MKTIIQVILITNMFIITTYAQNKSEIGFRINNYDFGIPNGFGFIYKAEVSEKNKKTAKNTAANNKYKPVNKPTTFSKGETVNKGTKTDKTDNKNINNNTVGSQKPKDIKPVSKSKVENNVKNIKPVDSKIIDKQNAVQNKPNNNETVVINKTDDKPVNQNNTVNNNIGISNNNFQPVDNSKPIVQNSTESIVIKAKSSKVISKDKKYNRYRFAVSAPHLNRTDENNSNLSFFVSGGMGQEKRTHIANGLYFIYGFESSVHYVVEKGTILPTDSRLLITSTGDIMGLHYDINDQFGISVESFSGVSNTMNLTNISDNNTKKFRSEDFFNFNPNASFALTVNYKF